MIGELQIIHGLQSVFDGPGGKAFVMFCAQHMIFLLVIPVIFTGWNLKRQNRALRESALRSAAAALLALIIAYIMGELIGRVRPFRADPEIALWIQAPLSQYAFPSIHTAVSFAVAFALVYGHASIGLLALLMASLVGFGRMATGVHYPSDVIAGVAIGFLAYYIVSELWRVFTGPRKKQPPLEQSNEIPQP